MMDVNYPNESYGSPPIVPEPSFESDGTTVAPVVNPETVEVAPGVTVPATDIVVPTLVGDVTIAAQSDTETTPSPVVPDEAVLPEPEEPTVGPQDGISFDKATYAPGETVTATVILNNQSEHVETRYEPSTLPSVLLASFGVQHPVGVLTDSGSHAWAYVEGSYDGVSAVFTTTA